MLALLAVLAPADGSLVTASASSADRTCEPGALIAEAGWGHAAMGVEEARARADGAGVLVAVVDSGVQADHPHLAGAVIDGRDVVALDAANTTGTRDLWGHGSAVAAIIAGRPVAGSGLTGIAPAATIIPIRVYYLDSDEGEKQGSDATPLRIAEGIRQAAQTGAKIIVVAMSTVTQTPEMDQAVAEATAAGALVIASMGNIEGDGDPSRPRYPASIPQVLAVGAFDQGFTPAVAYHGEHADVGGPGVGILATGLSGGDCVLGTPQEATSWATAHVAGVATLIAQLYPQESPSQWANRITATAARNVPEEHSQLVGWGLVQAPAALGFVDDGTARGPGSSGDGGLQGTTASEPVIITAYPDQWKRSRAVVAWWALGAGVVVAGCLIVTRLPQRRGDQGN